MNALTPVAIWLGSIRWLPRFLPQITAIDKFIQRVTKGQWSLLRIAGLPSMMLTVLGRKSGIARSTPILCIPYRDGHLIAGSNFGGKKPPVWVLNVRAADRPDCRSVRVEISSGCLLTDVPQRRLLRVRCFPASQGG